MKLSVYKEITSDLAIKFGDETLNIKYYPSKFTVQFQKELTEMTGSEKDNTKDFFEKILSLIAQWDLLDDNNKPFPINEDTIAQLPLALVLTIAGAISEGINPAPKTVAKSGSFS